MADIDVVDTTTDPPIYTTTPPTRRASRKADKVLKELRRQRLTLTDFLSHISIHQSPVRGSRSTRYYRRQIVDVVAHKAQTKDVFMRMPELRRGWDTVKDYVNTQIIRQELSML